MMALLSKALSAINSPKAIPSISGATPTVSKRWPGSRTKRTKIAERVGQREYFGRHAALGAADRLFLLSPFCALTVAMDFDDGGIDHGVFHIRLV